MRGLFVDMEALSTSFKNDASICLFTAVGALSVRLPPHEIVPKKFVDVAKEDATPCLDRYIRSASDSVKTLSFVSRKLVTSKTGVYSEGGW